MIPIICLAVITGCSNPGTENESEVSKKIEALIPEAASTPIEEFEKLNKTFEKLESSEEPVWPVKDIDNQTLTTVLVFFPLEWEPPRGNEKPSSPEVKLRDFNGFSEIFSAEETPDPAKLAKRIHEIIAAAKKSKDKGYATLIQPEHITDLTCKVEGKTATGTVSFEAKGLYKGRAEYKACLTDQGWKIEEFRLPGYQIRLTKQEDGKWKKSRIEDK